MYINHTFYNKLCYKSYEDIKKHNGVDMYGELQITKRN